MVATGTPGQSGAKITFTIAEDAPDTLYYYCANHSNMGSKLTLAINSTYLVLECYRILDPETYTDVFNDYYLKKYLTALIKQQWGQNLIKFEGMQMPGGVTFNGRQIYDDATADLEKLVEAKTGLKILSNYTDRSIVKIDAEIKTNFLNKNGYSGEEVRDGIINACNFALSDPYRAATHNKGIMNLSLIHI